MTELKKITNAKGIGSDPIQNLLGLAHEAENVDKMLLEQGIIPLNNDTVDLYGYV